MNTEVKDLKIDDKDTTDINTIQAMTEAELNSSFNILTQLKDNEARSLSFDLIKKMVQDSIQKAIEDNQNGTIINQKEDNIRKFTEHYLQLTSSLIRMFSSQCQFLWVKDNYSQSPLENYAGNDLKNYIYWCIPGYSGSSVSGAWRYDNSSIDATEYPFIDFNGVGASDRHGRVFGFSLKAGEIGLGEHFDNNINYLSYGNLVPREAGSFACDDRMLKKNDLAANNSNNIGMQMYLFIPQYIDIIGLCGLYNLKISDVKKVKHMVYTKKMFTRLLEIRKYLGFKDLSGVVDVDIKDDEVYRANPTDE